MYNVKSLKAEEFIDDQEILDTIEYAEANKNNFQLIDELLEKARPVKQGEGCVCKGLTHREAAVLLAWYFNALEIRLDKICFSRTSSPFKILGIFGSHIREKS